MDRVTSWADCGVSLEPRGRRRRRSGRQAWRVEQLEDRTLLSTSIPLSGSSWTALGPAPVVSGQLPGGGPVSGRVTGIAVNPTNASNIYVATAGGGVWDTSTGGTSWTPLTDGQATLFMGAVALAPSNPTQVIYAGTGESNNSGDSYYGEGILKSTDGGQTWTQMTNGGTFSRLVTAKIVVSPTDQNTFYAAMSVAGDPNFVGANTGIWKYNGQTQTWTNTTASISTTDEFSDLVMDPNDPTGQTLYAAVGTFFGSSVNGVYETTNGGSSWSPVSSVPSGIADGRIALAISGATSPSTLDVLITGSGQGGTIRGAFYKMVTVKGSVETDHSASVPSTLFGPSGALQGSYDISIAANPANANLVFAGGSSNGGAEGLIKSTDGGVTWTSVVQDANGNGPHTDSHAMVFDPSGNLLEGDDGGVFKYTMSTSTWSDLNSNLNVTQFIGVALNPQSADIAYGGSQDNGTEEFNNSLGWNLIVGGDGGYVRVDPTNPQTVYQELPGNFLQRSRDGGAHFTPITPSNASGGNFYVPYILNPSNSSELLYGTATLYESLDQGTSWTPVGTPGGSSFNPNGINIDAVAMIGTGSSTTIYVTAGGKVFVTFNNGSTWQERDIAGASDHFAALAVDNSNQQVAYAVRDRFNNGTSTGQVFVTTNSGQMWSNISGGFPNVPTSSLAVVPAVPNGDDEVIVGTDTGVYYTNNLGSNWYLLGSGLPNTRVSDLEYSSSLGILAAGTHGRGMWEIYTPQGPVLSAQSDTGVSNSDGITKDNGSASAPLVFTVSNVSPPNAYVYLYTVTGTLITTNPVQAVNGVATITLNGTNNATLADGTYEIADRSSTQSNGSGQSALSPFTTVTIWTNLATSTNPANGGVVSSLPNGQITITLSHPLAGLTSGGMANTASNPFGVFIQPRGPDLEPHAIGPYNYGGGPMAVQTLYTTNPDGTSTITITPTAPISTDVYIISIGSYADLAGNQVTQNGASGYIATFLLQLPPQTQNPLQVTGMSAFRGSVTINNNQIPQPDTIAIHFNKPLYTGAATAQTVFLGYGSPFQVVPTYVTYGPTTDTIFMTPTALLNPGTVYYITVQGQGAQNYVSDDQGFGGPGYPLQNTVYNSFTVSSSAVSSSSPLNVITESPVGGTQFPPPVGYVSLTFTEPLNMAPYNASTNPTGLQPYSVMLVPAGGGQTYGQLDPGDTLINERIAFNPNTNQLIIVPTSFVGNDLYLDSLAHVYATNGDQLQYNNGSVWNTTFKVAPAGSQPAMAGGAGTSGATVSLASLAKLYTADGTPLFASALNAATGNGVYSTANAEVAAAGWGGSGTSSALTSSALTSSSSTTSPIRPPQTATTSKKDSTRLTASGTAD